MNLEWIFLASSTKVLDFSEALHSGYENGQTPLLYGLLNTSGFVSLYVVHCLKDSWCKIMQRIPAWCWHQYLYVLHLPGALRKWRVSGKETSPFCGISAAEQNQELCSFWNKDFETGVSWKKFSFRLLWYCDPSCRVPSQKHSKVLKYGVLQPFVRQWCQGERYGESNVVAAPCSCWHAFCSSSVPRALGFRVFPSLTLSITLSITLTLCGALKQPFAEAEVPSTWVGPRSKVRREQSCGSAVLLLAQYFPPETCCWDL